MQYAQSTNFHYVYVGRIELSRAQARALSARTGQQWIYAVALRREVGGDKPLALTRPYLNPALKGIERVLRLVEFADNVHPASRFAYRIELRR